MFGFGSYFVTEDLLFFIMPVFSAPSWGEVSPHLSSVSLPWWIPQSSRYRKYGRGATQSRFTHHVLTTVVCEFGSNPACSST